MQRNIYHQDKGGKNHRERAEELIKVAYPKFSNEPTEVAKDRC